jgi:hypothetical protein
LAGVAALGLVACAPDNTPKSYDDVARSSFMQACTGDAFRLCSAEIPDVDRVTACMDAKRSQLSPPCRAQFRPDPEPEAAARPAGRPTVIRPAASRKAVSAKPRKAKKPAKPAT